MNLFEILQWWWENNVEWIKVHDPWVIPVMAVSVPLSFVIRAIGVVIKLWRGKN